MHLDLGLTRNWNSSRGADWVGFPDYFSGGLHRLDRSDSRQTQTLYQRTVENRHYRDENRHYREMMPIVISAGEEPKGI